MVDSIIDDTENCPDSSQNCPEMNQEHCPKSGMGEKIVKSDGYSMKKKLTVAVTFGSVILCAIIGISVGLGIDGEIKGKSCLIIEIVSVD